MRRGTLILLFFIILLAVGASYVVFWPNSGPNGKPLYGISNPFTIKEGLDLQGGIQVLLVPKPGQPTPTQEEMQNARSQIEKRVNGGLGVNEPSIRVQNSSSGPSISVELPGLNSGSQQEAIQTLLKTGNLEFWDTGSSGGLQDNTSFDPAQFAQSNGGTRPLFTGKDLDPNGLSVGQDSQTGAYLINFAMQGSAVGHFSSYTANHIRDYLTVTLDRKVITSATIQSQIPGNGQITGTFTLDQAQNIVNLLKYGALPIPLQIESEQIVGPTLGQDSIQRSIMAGAIGLGIVVIFMLLYYRLPGLLADIALVLFAILTFAVF